MPVELDTPPLSPNHNVARDALAQRVCIARITAWGRTSIQGEEIQDLADWSYGIADATIARGAKPT